MKTLNSYLSEAAGKNTHMTHIEDLILDLRKIRGVIAVFSFSSSEFEFSEYLND